MKIINLKAIKNESIRKVAALRNKYFLAIREDRPTDELVKIISEVNEARKEAGIPTSYDEGGALF